MNINIIENLEDRVETIVFLSKEQLTIEELAKFYEIEPKKMEEILLNLKEKRKKSGINVKIENGVVILVSNPLYGEDVKRFFNPETKIKKLTRSTMETLAIIAYKGPITKTEIEQIRGVSVEKTMANLIEKNLVYISGKKKTIGTPNLYEVTEDFYSYLDINDKSELPGYEQYEKIELMYKNQEEEIEKENKESVREKIEEKEKIEVENETE
mgnify:CR=1 FL=1